ncbi:hypothetical protein ACFYXL_25540 [Streptomyces tsukubensis]|uniref:hypothetical protein n=1 Tax=Streptomyces tsukubensis TaxID=83656 RepID=UPI0036C563A0
MVKRLGIAVASVAASAGLVLGTAGTAEASWWVPRSHHPTTAACQDAGKAGAAQGLWSPIFFCNQIAPGVVELRVRYN